MKTAAGQGAPAWTDEVRRHVGWSDAQCAPVGQDIAFAERLSRKFVTTGGIVQAIERAINDGLASARAARPLAEGSPLAADHGTRYPILQGPMTRVSDVAAFAQAVADEGALPFLALALLREHEVQSLLRETSRSLGARPGASASSASCPPNYAPSSLPRFAPSNPRLP